VRILKHNMIRSIAANWICPVVVAFALWGYPPFAAAQSPGSSDPPEHQSELYCEKTLEFIALAWDESGEQVLEDFFQNNKEESARYLLELGEYAFFNTSFYRDKKLSEDLVFVASNQQHKVLWLHERIATHFLANNEEISDAQDEALQSLAHSWIQVAERRYPILISGQRRYAVHLNRQMPEDRIKQGSPDGLWFERLPPDLKLRVHSVYARMYTTKGNYKNVIESIRAAAEIDSQKTLILAEEFLFDWELIKPQIEMEDIADLIPEGEITEESEAIRRAALENARFEEKMRILFESLANFKAIFSEEKYLNPDAVMYAFAGCHAPGRIYAREDFDKLMSLLNGPKEKVVTQTSQIMGASIHAFWSEFNSAIYEDPELAEKAMFDAVREGYALVDEKLMMVLEDAPPNSPKRWEYAATLGRMRLDAADFYLSLVEVIEPWENDGKSVLRSFKLQRDAALEALDLATEIYCEVVPTLTRGQYSPQVFIARFESIMKLTDIAMASLPANLRDEELRSLRDDLLALEGHVAEGHFEALVKWFEGTYEGVEPKDKYKFLNCFATVIGDNLAGARYKSELEEYDDWSQEIQLHVQVDGDRHIGCGQEFGVFLAFRHSTTLGLDSDIKYYLAMQEYMNKFREDISHSLRDTFLVKDVRYHEPGARSYDYGREGWQETPLAYVLLAAKDPAIDRIPSIELNLEYPPPQDVFSNDSYQIIITGVNDEARQEQFERSVLLPVRSEVIQVNSYPDRKVGRPCRDIAITQTLDDRNFKNGEILINVSARGKGLLPELENILRVEPEASAIPGFKITDIRDLGIVMNDLDSNTELTVDSTRRWSVVLTLDQMNRDKAESFQFLTAESQDTEMLYRRYDDAEILPCSSEIRLAWIPPNIYANTRNVLMVVIAFVLLVVLIRLGAKIQARPKEREEYCLPDEITPFSVFSILHRIHDDRRIELSDQQRQELEQNMSAVERSYYAEVPEKSGIDLKAVADQWLMIARKSLDRHDVVCACEGSEESIRT
jgi:hypothetical protein